MAESVTQILNSGPVGLKRNIAVLGDGFTEADFDAYNKKVGELLLDGIFTNDYFREDRSAFNIFRVNLISAESGISTRTWIIDPDDPDKKKEIPDPKREKPLDTALKYIFTGQWGHCWLEEGPDTPRLRNEALEKWVPDYNLVFIILNTTGYGGCGGNGVQVVTMGAGWRVVAHEFGHGAANLGDEYCTKSETKDEKYKGSDDWRVNITSGVTDRSSLKWNPFVSPDTPIPTGTGSCAGYTAGTRPSGWSDTDDVGLFEGGATWFTRAQRPVVNCRMRNHTIGQPFCTICYNELKQRHHSFTQHHFWLLALGDFDGDGRDDVLSRSRTNARLFQSTGNALEVAFTASEAIPGSWRLQPSDRQHVADFDDDGADEVLVYNGWSWPIPYLGLLDGDGKGGLRLVARYDGALPGWRLHPEDRFYVGDFDGDGKADLMVYNGTGWSSRWFAMYRSTGTGFELTARFRDNLGGWAMRPNDQHLIGDFDGDGRADVYVVNTTDWGDAAWFGMFRSTGAGLERVRLYDRFLPGWAMRRHDEYYVADFDADGKDDIYVVNKKDWDKSVLAMQASTGTGLRRANFFSGATPGWSLRGGDAFSVADIDGDGREGLVVTNYTDWNSKWVGILRSDGTSLTGQAHSRFGDWKLDLDAVEVCNYAGGLGRSNLILHNAQWLGLVRLSPSVSLDRRYFQWVHNYRHGQNW